MAFAGCSVEGALPLWRLPPPYEDDRLSWPARQSVRYAGDDPQLEHDRGDYEDSEGRPGETCRATSSQPPVAWKAIGRRRLANTNFPRCSGRWRISAISSLFRYGANIRQLNCVENFEVLPVREIHVEFREQTNIHSYTAMLRQRNCASFFGFHRTPSPGHLDCAFSTSILRINLPPGSTARIRF